MGCRNVLLAEREPIAFVVSPGNIITEHRMLLLSTARILLLNLVTTEYYYWTMLTVC